MKKLLLFSLVTILLVSCGSMGTGDLVGVQNRPFFSPVEPFGMVFCKSGSYQMGPNDQDVTWAMTSEQKTVSVSPFWIDQTEITNNEYRQFVNWVRDSIAYKILGAEVDEETYLITQNDYEEDIDFTGFDDEFNNEEYIDNTDTNDIFDTDEFEYSSSQKPKCNICSKEYTDSGIKKHISSCINKNIKGDETLYYLVIKDRYMSNLYLHILVLYLSYLKGHNL